VFLAFRQYLIDATAPSVVIDYSVNLAGQYFSRTESPNDLSDSGAAPTARPPKASGRRRERPLQLLPATAPVRRRGREVARRLHVDAIEEVPIATAMSADDLALGYGAAREGLVRHHRRLGRLLA
jgi:hypothetical protein